MNELLTKLKVFGHVLWVLWTLGLGYLLITTPITNPNVLGVIFLCLVVYLTPIVVVKVIWWILPVRWKVKESI